MELMRFHTLSCITLGDNTIKPLPKDESSLINS